MHLNSFSIKLSSLKLGTMAMSKDELDYIKNLFNKMDIDQNGRVGLTEFLKGRHS